MATGNPPDELSPDQAIVLAKIEAWIRNPGAQQYLTVGGYAGTGKTTLIARLIRMFDFISVCALAGKAAQVLRSKGVPASTIHSLIYIPEEQADGSILYLLRGNLNPTKIVFVDEASMVNADLLRDLSSFGLPILFVGDHGQLEPIGDSPNLMASPTLRLEKIHRQAADNPILKIAHAFREGNPVAYADYNKGDQLKVVRKPEFWNLINPDYQIICGFNATRHSVNRIVRKQLGHEGTLVENERIIVLRNNRDFGVFNGQQLTVKKIIRRSPRSIRAEVEDDDCRRFELTFMVQQFGIDAMIDHRDRSIILADYAYCITCHKAQGSEYPRVLVLDEMAAKWDRKRWRYTAATRAKNELIYCA